LKAPVILITGFGPFPGQPDNPTTAVAEALRREGREAHVLPTEYKAGLEIFRGLLARIQPDIVVCFGVAGTSDCVRLERFAANAVRADLADALGVCHAGDRIDMDGPARFDSTLPLERIAARLTAADIPHRYSDDAGGYLCNYIFYNLMHETGRGGKPVQSGFIHMPPADAPGFSQEKLLAAAKAVIAACADRGPMPAPPSPG
jgi:pyroglutamyl-peptidase